MLKNSGPGQLFQVEFVRQLRQEAGCLDGLSKHDRFEFFDGQLEMIIDDQIIETSRLGNFIDSVAHTCFNDTDGLGVACLKAGPELGHARRKNEDVHSIHPRLPELSSSLKIDIQQNIPAI